MLRTFRNLLKKMLYNELEATIKFLTFYNFIKGEMYKGK